MTLLRDAQKYEPRDRFIEPISRESVRHRTARRYQRQLPATCAHERLRRSSDLSCDPFRRADFFRACAPAWRFLMSRLALIVENSFRASGKGFFYRDSSRALRVLTDLSRGKKLRFLPRHNHPVRILPVDTKRQFNLFSSKIRQSRCIRFHSS